MIPNTISNDFYQDFINVYLNVCFNALHNHAFYDRIFRAEFFNQIDIGLSFLY